VSLRDRVAALDDRERRLLGILGIVFCGLLVLSVPLGFAAVLSSERGTNEALSGSIEAIDANRTIIEQRAKERAQTDQRYEKPAPPLTGLLAGIAKRTNIDIPESQDRASVPHGTRFEERSTRIVLRKVGMYNLVKFMEEIEQTGHPVSISKLNIRKRAVEPDSYDVELILSAFDRKEKEKPKQEEGEARSADAGASEDEEKEEP
jgi:general secretion pathway protein M